VSDVVRASDFSLFVPDSAAAWCGACAQRRNYIAPEEAIRPRRRRARQKLC